MCGIAGIIGDHDLDGDNLGRMRERLRHRGPDGAGCWRSPSGQASFAHTRLAVFDPTIDGAQPMTIDGRYTIVYNGAVYNYEALRAELETSGCRFVTRTDTEVVAQLWARDGAAALPRLRGMFALAIWDEQTRTCVLARDRFGIKPLYIASRGGALLFASEVRALAASGLVGTEIDPHAVFGYLRYGSVPEPLTMLKGVRPLSPGHYAVWRDGGVHEHCFASAHVLSERCDDPPSLRLTLEQSVAAHMAGDVPVGLFLSGGLDSTALLLLSRGSARPLRTLSVSLPGSPDDEGPLARRTAAAAGVEHREFGMSAARARELLPAFLSALDQPSIDGFNTYVASRLAADAGVKVVLSGIGADELFGGYPTFTGVPSLARLHAAVDRWLPAPSVAGRLLERFGGSHRTRRIGDLLQQPPSVEAAYDTYRGVFTRGEAATLTLAVTGATVRSTDGSARLPSGADPIDQVSTLEITRYVRNQLLRDADSVSMACGVEVRTPYLDAAVLDTAARIPATQRTAAGKTFLRSTIQDVPEWVASRGKQCFQFPFDAWLSGELRDMVDPVERQAGVALDTWYRKWSLFVLRSWTDHLRTVMHA